MILGIAVLTVLSTLSGGLFALKFRDKLHLILGFSAGAVIGVVFFDLLPEAFDLATTQYGATTVTLLMALGFIFFMIFDRAFSIHAHDNEGCQNQNHRGKFGAATLSLHSFLDGAAIGLAFKVSPSVGAIVALAVLTHDFSDGINTVNIILKNGGSRRQAFNWLLSDAFAPALGLLSTFFFAVPAVALGLILAVFAGFFLYIGASDLLPESHHRHPTAWTTLTTIFGIVLLYLVVRLASI